jgi:hypothetical protein
VDPEHPVLSLSGHAGADFKYEGQEKWTDAFGGKWTVGVLQSGVPNGAPSGTIFYEASTGLVMYHYDSSYVGRVRVTEITWYHIAPFPAGSDWG